MVEPKFFKLSGSQTVFKQNLTCILLSITGKSNYISHSTMRYPVFRSGAFRNTLFAYTSFFSTNYEMTEEQVLSTLQTIFGVKLPTASEKAATENMDLPQIADLLKMKKSEEEKEQNNITTDQNNEQQGAIITKSGLDNYNELISDILTEVLLKMAKGKISTFY